MSKIRLPVQESEYATHLEIEVDYDKGAQTTSAGIPNRAASTCTFAPSPSGTAR
jgi:hypothetical protein